MIITPEYLTIIYARQKFDRAEKRWQEQQAKEQSLVETNAADFIVECDRLGIESQADDSVRA